MTIPIKRLKSIKEVFIFSDKKSLDSTIVFYNSLGKLIRRTKIHIREKYPRLETKEIYEYANNQLVKVSHFTNGEFKYDSTFEYDSFGNITEIKNGLSKSLYFYDNQNRVILKRDLIYGGESISTDSVIYNNGIIRIFSKSGKSKYTKKKYQTPNDNIEEVEVYKNGVLIETSINKENSYTEEFTRYDSKGNLLSQRINILKNGMAIQEKIREEQNEKFKIYNYKVVFDKFKNWTQFEKTYRDIEYFH